MSVIHLGNVLNVQLLFCYYCFSLSCSPGQIIYQMSLQGIVLGLEYQQKMLTHLQHLILIFPLKNKKSLFLCTRFLFSRWQIHLFTFTRLKNHNADRSYTFINIGVSPSKSSLCDELALFLSHIFVCPIIIQILLIATS